MENIDKIIRRIVNEEVHKIATVPKDRFYCCEGIDIKYKNGKGFISFNATHQNGVNTSVYENPTVEYMDGIEVWSIFQRNKHGIELTKDNDGNPLIHALKGNENGWFFETPRDKELILGCANRILKKFHNEHWKDVTVMIPSTSFINKLLAEMYKAVDPNTPIVKGLYLKMSTEDVLTQIKKPNSLFMRHYSRDGYDLDGVWSELMGYINKMNETKNGCFVYHMIENAEMRNQIEDTLSISPNVIGKYGNLINGKDVLLIDDSISRGSTIKQAVKLLKECFIPNSITVLTMFSKTQK